jgi:hypothetical protein
VTLKLLQQHQRFNCDQYQVSEKDLDLRQSFPRIKLISVAAKQNDFSWYLTTDDNIISNTLHVEIFKPITLENLQNCGFSFLDRRKCKTVFLFGTKLVNTVVEPQVLIASDIHNLTIRDGASIILPSDEPAALLVPDYFEMLSTKAFSISLEQREPDEWAESLLRLVMAAAKRKHQCNVNLREIHTPSPTLNVRCYPSMLGPLLRVVSACVDCRIESEQ